MTVRFFYFERGRNSERIAWALALGVLALLLAAPGAGAQTARQPRPPAQLRIGHVTLSAPTPAGGAALLVPVHYPIQYSGRVVPLSVRFSEPGGRFVGSLVLHERIGAGLVRIGDRRRRFTFVHRVGLSPALARALRGGGLEVRIRAGGGLDVNEDGVPELTRRDQTPVLAPLQAPGNGRLCSSVPRLRIAPGKAVSVPLPACTSAVRWRIAHSPASGRAKIRNGRLVYRAPKSFRGATGLVLRGRPQGVGAISAAGGGAGVPAPVQIFVGPPAGIVVRAMGDSVTAGFGYYGNGEEWPFLALPECRPAGPPYNDACSSNSEVSSDKSKLFEYAADYGLANNVSWAAQWANEYGVTNYENLAISGSEPSEWAPGGVLHEKTAQIESEDPDYILMTIGANPLLSEVLFGTNNWGCAIYTDFFGEFRECIERAFAKVDLQANLRKLYTDLVEHTRATIYLMQYPLTVPSVAIAYTATQIAEMGQLLDAEIAKVAGEVSPTRLRVIAPPHFNVGIDVSPVYPSNYSCSRLGFEVDGPSVQSDPTEDELEILHPFSFCAGPVPPGPPWVISGDTGIHPSAAGYTQMASQVPAPG
ncbi:MAG TPA: SGNH/GDSL hydrolase family protein [Solirubrobacterales bacterium]